MMLKLRRVLSMLLILGILSSAGTLSETGTDFEGAVSGEEVDTSASDDVYGGTVADEYTTLQKGDKDSDDSGAVVRLQARLVELKYLSDEPDGAYGGDTVDAITDFQLENGLEATGIADSRTQEMLFSDRAKEAPFRYDSENVVSRVQKCLIEWGFLTGTPDGKNGKQTQSAVAKFNAYLIDYMKVYPTPAPEATPDPASIKGFSDGLIVEDTLLATEEDTSINDTILAYVDGIYEFNTYRQTVKTGDDNDEVLRVQTRLKALNYLYQTDGSFGEATERALLYFQKKNGLSQTGIADEETQKRLFSDNCVVSEEFINAYKLVVDVSEQRVYIFQWNGSDYNTLMGKTKCSTGLSGKQTETPRGTFQAGGPSGTGMWYHFKTFRCYAKWGYFIVGGIMFHSVIYTEKKKLISGSVDNLGRKASHGCVRLPTKAAKWIYDNCPKGTTVVIQD